MTSEWPAYYPPNVPPSAAVDATGTAYRIVKTIPPGATDFRSTLEVRVEKGGSVPDDQLWQACGTSVHTDLADSRRTRDRFPPLRGQKIVVGELLPQHGKMMPTGGASHVTVWFRVSATPHTAFVTNAESNT